MTKGSNKIQKLLSFNWKTLRRDSIYWILLFLSSFSQLICFLGLYFTNTPIMDYSVVCILVPNIMNALLITFGVIKLVIDSRNNMTDIRLLCSNLSSYQIKISRFLSIFLSILAAIILQDVSLLFLVTINLSQFVYIFLLTNTLITPFILLFFLIINIWAGQKISKLPFSFLSIFLIIITFGVSLITRVTIEPQKFDEIQTSKLGYQDNNYLIANNFEENEHTEGQNIKNPLLNNKMQMINNFIPSEWLLTYYSCAFDRFGFSPQNHQLDILSYALEPTVLSEDEQNSKGLNLRTFDQNPLELSNYDYELLILKNIDEIVQKYALMTNKTLVQQINLFLTNAINWQDVDNKQIKQFLLDITGHNTQYNQLFYLIKYQSILLKKIPNLFSYLETAYNKDLADLIKNIIFSNSTYFNLFLANNDFSVGTIYPNNYIANPYEPIIEKDQQFLRYKFLKFGETDVFYLTQNLTYETLSSEALTRLKLIINNQTDWNKIVDKISLTYQQTKDFLNQFYQVLPDSYHLQLANNYLDLSSNQQIYSISNATNTNYPVLIISIFSIINCLVMIGFFVNTDNQRKIK